MTIYINVNSIFKPNLNSYATLVNSFQICLKIRSKDLFLSIKGKLVKKMDISAKG